MNIYHPIRKYLYLYLQKALPESEIMEPDKDGLCENSGGRGGDGLQFNMGQV